MNVVRLVGELGDEPECRALSDGRGSVLRLRVCTDDEHGREWHRVTLSGPSASVLQSTLSKGDTVIVHGHLRTTSLTRRGQTHYVTEVVASRVLRSCARPRQRGA